MPKMKIQAENLPERVRAADGTKSEVTLPETFSLKEGKVLLEKRLIEKALASTKGNKSQAQYCWKSAIPRC